MDRPIEDTAPQVRSDPHTLQARIGSLVGDQDFERIRSKLTKFNFFEAIGAQRREVRHSDFLAFLLDPKRNHGLGDGFLRRFLKRSLRAKLTYPGPDNFQIERESSYVDILLHDDKNRVAVIIENKIDSDEHDNQLERYWRATRDLYPEYSLFGIYLTPEGDEPAHNSGDYVPVGYAGVANLIEEILKSDAATCAPAVGMALKHYIEMVRRDIVPDSDVQQLCEEVYFKYRDVLDKIFEFKPDLQSVIRKFIEQLVGSESEKFILDARGTKRFVRFAVKEWQNDEFKALRQGPSDWGEEGRMLLFQFSNEISSLKLKLIIGPGPIPIRQRLLDLAQTNNVVLKAASKTLNEKWNEIYNRPVLSKSSLEDLSTSDVEDRIKTEWKQFVEDDFPKIRGLVGSIRWGRR